MQDIWLMHLEPRLNETPMTIECLRFKPHKKTTLLGFADFWIPRMGIEIRGCSLHQKDGRRWVNLPQVRYENDAGETKYSYTVFFRDSAHSDAFCRHAKEAIDKWCAENGKQASEKLQEKPNDG